MEGLIIAVLLIAGVVGAAWVSARSGNLADVEISPDRVDVRLRGFNRFWAFKRELSIPMANVKDATYVPYAPGFIGGLRWPGTAIPGVMTAGTYLSRGSKSFFAVHRGENALVLELDDWKYRRVIVDTKDPDVLASQITDLIEGAG